MIISTSIFIDYRVPGIILYTQHFHPFSLTKVTVPKPPVGLVGAKKTPLAQAQPWAERRTGYFLCITYYIILLTYVHMCIHITITALINNVDHT